MKYYLKSYLTLDRETRFDANACTIRINEPVPKEIPEDWIRKIVSLLSQNHVMNVLPSQVRYAMDIVKQGKHSISYNDFTINVFISPPTFLPDHPMESIDYPHYVIDVVESSYTIKRRLERLRQESKREHSN